MQKQKKIQLEQRRRWRIRKKVVGTKSRPRMSVRFTNAHVYVQFIDDSKGVTLASVSSRDKSAAPGPKVAANVEGATKIGKLAGEAAREKGIEGVVFDRSGARYHGKIKALAEAAREAGLKF